MRKLLRNELCCVCAAKAVKVEELPGTKFDVSFCARHRLTKKMLREMYRNLGRRDLAEKV